jgi:hypothetical protein
VGGETELNCGIVEPSRYFGNYIAPTLSLQGVMLDEEGIDGVWLDWNPVYHETLRKKENTTAIHISPFLPWPSASPFS